MKRLADKANTEKLNADIKEEGRKCLHHQDVIEIILSNAIGNPLSVDALCDKVMKEIAGRYYFSAEYTLEDMIAAEVAGGHLKFDRNTRMLSRP